VGDVVNLAQRLQDLARPAGVTVLSDATAAALPDPPPLVPLPPQTVRGRDAPVVAFRMEPA
jgi:class 3 adenylate cyclase